MPHHTQDIISSMLCQPLCEYSTIGAHCLEGNLFRIIQRKLPHFEVVLMPSSLHFHTKKQAPVCFAPDPNPDLVIWHMTSHSFK